MSNILKAGGKKRPAPKAAEPTSTRTGNSKRRKGETPTLTGSPSTSIPNLSQEQVKSLRDILEAIDASQADNSHTITCSEERSAGTQDRALLSKMSSSTTGQCQKASVAELDTGTNTYSLSPATGSLLSATRPLHAMVSHKLKVKVWKGEFVDFFDPFRP